MQFLKKLVIHFCLIILVFLYLYPIPFTFLPLSTRIVIAAFGGAFYLSSLLKAFFTNGQFSFSERSAKVAGALAILAALNFISCIVNQTADFEFVKLGLSMVYIYFSYVALSYVFRHVFEKVTFSLIGKYILYAIVIQVGIALAGYIYKPFAMFINSIQKIDEAQLVRITGYLAFRMMGLGSSFFGAGIVNGFGLMIIAVIVKQGNHTRRALMAYGVAFLLLFLVGIAMARTTFVGLILAFIYMLFPAKKISKVSFKNVMFFLAILVAIPLLVIVLVNYFFPGIATQFQSAFRFGFELFVNYSETGQATSASSEELKGMYVYPDEMKTYLIGDGRYYIEPGSPGSGYYKGTDVGFLRTIYLVGIPGLLSYFYFQYRSIEVTFRNFGPSIRLFGALMFVFVIILNFKGFADVFSLILLFNIAMPQTQQPDHQVEYQ